MKWWRARPGCNWVLCLRPPLHSFTSFNLLHPIWSLPAGFFPLLQSRWHSQITLPMSTRVEELLPLLLTIWQLVFSVLAAGAQARRVMENVLSLPGSCSKVKWNYSFCVWLYFYMCSWGNLLFFLFFCSCISLASFGPGALIKLIKTQSVINKRLHHYHYHHYFFSSSIGADWDGYNPKAQYPPHTSV